MVRLRSQYWVILICAGISSGLFQPQQAQALGWCGPCGGRLFRGCGLFSGVAFDCGPCAGWGGCGPYGGYGWGGGAAWGGGCGWGGCGPRIKYRYRMKCKPRRRWVCDSYAVAGGCGIGGGQCGTPTYATGTYLTPSQSDDIGSRFVPAPDPATLPNFIPAPASAPQEPVEVPPAPEAPLAPAPEQGQLPPTAPRTFTLQSHEQSTFRGPGIVVYVPEQARVYVNDRLMKTPGTERCFAAGRMVEGKVYDYEIRAEMVRNGTTIVRQEKVALKAGHLEEVTFDFSDTVAPIQTVQGLYPETKLTVLVPEDASVYLEGADTVSVGKVRKFITTELSAGESWKDYEIKVEVERNGRSIVKSQRISLFAGQAREVEFNFGDEKPSLLKRLTSSR